MAACIIILPEFATGSAFSVAFRDHGRAVAGLRVGLHGPGNQVMEATTDAAGVAKFRALPRGDYSLGDRGAGFGSLAWVQVGKRPLTPQKRLALEWPGDWRDPIKARALHGSIRAAYTLPPEERSLAAELDVFDGANGRLLRTVRLAAGQREFDLRALPPGRYALTLRQPSEGSEQLGPVLVEVDPRAQADGFDLLVGTYSCGAWVHDRTTCRQVPLRLSRLAGRVVDSAGGSLPGATLLLLDAAQAELARVNADDQGRFASPVSLRPGRTLAIYKLGFTPLRLEIAEGGTPPLPGGGELTVKLGVIGGCGQAEVR